MTADALPDVVVAAVNGDAVATERLLAAISPLIVRYCRARIRKSPAVSAEDVAQEVCLAVLRALPGYRDRQRPFMAFVYGIAAHKVADAFRAASRDQAQPVAQLPDLATAEAGPEQRAISEDLSTRLARLLATLPNRQREILILRVAVGLSAEETADLIGSTAGAVRVAQHRALEQLRRHSDTANLRHT